MKLKVLEHWLPKMELYSMYLKIKLNNLKTFSPMPKKVEDAATSRNDEGVQKIPNTKVAPTITNSPAREVGNGVQVISKEKHQFALAHIRKNYGAGSPEYNLVLLLIQRINSAKTDEELSEANNALSNFMNTKKNKHSKTREGAKQN